MQKIDKQNTKIMYGNLYDKNSEKMDANNKIFLSFVGCSNKFQKLSKGQVGYIKYGNSKNRLYIKKGNEQEPIVYAYIHDKVNSQSIAFKYNKKTQKVYTERCSANLNNNELRIGANLHDSPDDRNALQSFEISPRFIDEHMIMPKNINKTDRYQYKNKNYETTDFLNKITLDNIEKSSGFRKLSNGQMGYIEEENSKNRVYIQKGKNKELILHVYIDNKVPKSISFKYNNYTKKVDTQKYYANLDNEKIIIKTYCNNHIDDCKALQPFGIIPKLIDNKMIIPSDIRQTSHRANFIERARKNIKKLCL